MRLLREKIGAEPKFFFISLFFFLIFVLNIFFNLNFELNVYSLHFGLFFLGFSFVYEKNIGNTIRKLFGKLDIVKLIVYLVSGVVMIILYLILLNYSSIVFYFNDSGNITEKIGEFTPLIIFAALFIGPLSEEMFFRGFLVNRFGIVLSSILFSLSHFAYGSIVEILGAFGIGIVLAFVYKKSGSLIPCILIHFLFNLISLTIYWMM